MIDDDPPTTKDKPEQTGAEDAWNAEGWRDAAREYHQQRGNRCVVVDIEPARRARLRKLMGDNVSIERAWSEINQRDHVPASTPREKSPPFPASPKRQQFSSARARFFSSSNRWLR